MRPQRWCERPLFLSHSCHVFSPSLPSPISISYLSTLMGFEWPVGRGRSVRPSAIAALTGRKFDRRSGAHFRFSFKQHWSRLYSSTTDMQEQAKARLRESRHLAFSGLRNLDFAFSSMSVNKISFEVHRLPPDFTTKDVTPMRGCICSIPLPDPSRRPLQCTADLIPGSRAFDRNLESVNGNSGDVPAKRWSRSSFSLSYCI